MKRILFFLLLLPFALIGGNENDSIGPERRFAVGVNIGPPKRLYGGDYATDEGPYYFLRGRDNHHSYSIGGFARWYINNSVFIHAGTAFSFRSYSNYDSITLDPDTYSDFMVTTLYTGYRVNEVNYKSANFSVDLGAGYEVQLHRLRFRATCGMNYMRYTKLNFDFKGRSHYIKHTDTTATGGTYEEIRNYTGHETWEGPRLWGIGLNTGAELEFRISKWIGLGASANFGAVYSALKKGKWAGDYTGTEDISDTNGNSTNYVNTAEADYELDVKRFEFSPITAQMNIVFYFGK